MKLKLTFLALVLYSFSMKAQNKWSAEAGVNLGTFSNGIIKEGGNFSIASFHFGIVYEYQLSSKISFNSKLIYSQQGDIEKSSLGGYLNFKNVDYKLNYLNLPLNFKFFNKPYIILGPQFGYLISTEKLSANFGEVQNKIDYGPNIGFGYEFNKLNFEVNFYQGMNTLLTHTGNALNENFTVTNTVIQFSLGYRIK